MVPLKHLYHPYKPISHGILFSEFGKEAYSNTAKCTPKSAIETKRINRCMCEDYTHPDQITSIEIDEA